MSQTRTSTLLRAARLEKARMCMDDVSVSEEAMVFMHTQDTHRYVHTHTYTHTHTHTHTHIHTHTYTCYVMSTTYCVLLCVWMM
jgi:hypothetical protein